MPLKKGVFADYNGDFFCKISIVGISLMRSTEILACLRLRGDGLEPTALIKSGSVNPEAT
jgi:hypothetical protein